MKFAKELDESAVAEWKGQYLDYRGAKKKLKAVQRAYRAADKSPSNIAPAFGSSLRDAPVFSFLRRDQQDPRPPPEATDGTSLRLTRSRSEASSPRLSRDAETASRSSARAIPVTERSPLRGQRDEVSGRMKRYGSIIGTPPEENGLVTVESRPRRQSASLLELPIAALDPTQPKHAQKRDLRDVDPDYDRPVSPGESSRPQPPPSQLSHTGDAYVVSRPQDDANTISTAQPMRKLFHKHRSNTASDKLPFMRRVFSVSGPPSGSLRQTDVALEAYREIDFRREDFFSYLDKQLNKVDTFYIQREEESTDRLKAIREQLHVLRDRRRYEIIAQEAHQRDPARRGMSKASSLHPEEDGHAGGDRRLSSMAWLAPVDHAVTHIDHALDKVRGSHVGKTSRRMDELASPAISEHAQGANDRQDYVRRPPSKDVPYRVAKRRLKTALAEFYRSLELLKSYALLNRTAFRKINKKYDKTINAHSPLRYMDKVNKRHFVNSDVLEGHIHAVEDLYARYFERGNHKVAVNKLRSKIARAEDFTGSIWRQGVMLAAGAVFAIEGLVYGVHDLYEVGYGDTTQASYLLQIYAGYFLMVFLMGFFVLDTRIFEKNKVNYQFVFEFNRPLNWRQLSEIPAYFFFLLGIVMWLNFTHVGGATMYIYWPLVLLGVTVVLLLVPPPFFYWKSRVWFLYTNWRLLFAGLYPVEFRDFFYGDMLCSLTYATGNISLFFCLYAHHWNDPGICNSTSSRLLGFFTTLPGIIRALQCLRRYRDTKNVFPHLVNCGKYTFTILYYTSLSIFRIDKSTENLALFIVFATVNAIYCIIWDIAMDWSLLDIGSKNFMLRDTLAFKQKRYYYAAIPIDIIGRFNWIFYAIFAQDVGHASIVSFAVAFSEVCRRGVWTLLRVENEHCTNVNRSRAIRDVPLPYAIHESTESLIDKSTKAQEERRQGVRLDNDASTIGRPSLAITSTPSRQTTGVDVERGGTTPGSLRRRPTFSADSPVLRTLRRVGSTMLAAHAQDYERKRRPEAATEQDDSDDASSDSDDGKTRSRVTRDPKKRHGNERKERQKAFEELPEELHVEEEAERRNREDLAAAEDAFAFASRKT